MTLSDHQKLARYAERFFARYASTRWPTVREVAKALHWPVRRVESAVEGDPNNRLALTYYNVSWDPPLGHKFVECL